MWFDNLAIPKDAPHPQEAHELINYLIKPEVAAKNTNYVWYANGDQPSQLIDPAILNDQTIYPDAATMANFYTIVAHDAKTQRLINRLWTRVKTGNKLDKKAPKQACRRSPDHRPCPPDLF